MAVHHTMCFVFTILVLCNAVLYPSIFSSIFRKWFGSETTDDKEKAPDMPPQMRGSQRSPGATRRMEMERTAQRNMKHAGDPASYFAQQKQEASKGRGVMGSVLPLYAVGIVIYFAYIMYRIFLKDKPNKPNEPDATAMWETEKDDNALLHRVQQEQLQKKLSEQLRADNYNGVKSRRSATPKTPRTTTLPTQGKAATEGSPDEMTALKKRLEDTERSMQRMMDMMNNMGVAMSQVTEQLTGTVPTGLTNSLNPPTHEEGDTDDEDSNEGGQRSSEEFPNSDLESEEDFPLDVDLTKTYTGVGDDSNDEGGRGDVEIIGGVGLAELEVVRRRVVSTISGES